MSYGNYGRVNTYNTTFTDPQINGNTQQISASYTYPTTDAPSNNFAPVNANNGDISFEYGINGSIRKRTTSLKTEYYLYNAFDQMKAYSDNGNSYGYYGYDDAGQRMYKIHLNTFSSNTNIYPNTKILEVEKLMLYPNSYININQNGEYTKHYYADAERIASKIGTGFKDSISGAVVQNDTLLATMKRELGGLTKDTIDNIIYTYEQIRYFGGDSNKYEDGLYYYHGNHLSSTQLITDMYGNVSQAVLYTPWGNIISEYRQDWMIDTIPRYLFSAKEKDEESGMYYYEARYYNPPSFISRDPLFEKKPFMSPYAYCRNNPLIFIDPNGEDEYEFDQQGNHVKTIPNDKIASFHIVDKDGNRIANTGEFDAKSVTHHTPTINGTKTDIFDIKGDRNATEVFEMFADNTSVEWTHAKTGEKVGQNGSNIVGTSHSTNSTSIGHYLRITGYTLREVNHNHPRGNMLPSGAREYIRTGNKTDDLKGAELYMQKNPNIRLNIYTTKSGYSPYNDKGTLDTRISYDKSIGTFKIK
jgi:RHS repeat-associated protein